MRTLTLLTTLLFINTIFSQDFKYKSYYKDTSSVNIFVSVTVFCNKKEVDSSFSMRHVGVFNKENFAIYYDKKFTKPAQCFFIKNDTAYAIYYYRNGIKKERR